MYFACILMAWREQLQSKQHSEVLHWSAAHLMELGTSQPNLSWKPIRGGISEETYHVHFQGKTPNECHTMLSIEYLYGRVSYTLNILPENDL